MSDDRYRLIDFGGGRKLESVAGRLIDRPSPAAEGFQRSDRRSWHQAESYFDSDAKRWRHQTPWPNQLLVDCGGFRMPIRPTPFGHIGLFPEQYDNWQWLRSSDGNDRAALNLFAYTGAATMALVAAGFSVAHVDAAKPNVESAREAATANDWQERSIRYLVDDAAKFAAREVRRNRTYHTIVLDPPAYGHGPGGRAWRLERDLWPLLADCLQLLDRQAFRILVTGHSPEVSASEIEQFFARTSELPPQTRDGLRIESGRSELKDEFDRLLDAGFFVRVAYGTS